MPRLWVLHDFLEWAVPDGNIRTVWYSFYMQTVLIYPPWVVCCIQVGYWHLSYCCVAREASYVCVPRHTWVTLQQCNMWKNSANTNKPNFHESDDRFFCFSRDRCVSLTSQIFTWNTHVPMEGIDCTGKQKKGLNRFLKQYSGPAASPTYTLILGKSISRDYPPTLFFLRCDRQLS